MALASFDAHAAFREALQEITELPGVVHWQGEVFDPPRAPYVRERFESVALTTRVIGGGQAEELGQYLVDLLYPIDRGSYDLWHMRRAADAVLSRFWPGASLSATPPIIVTDATVSGPIAQTPWALLALTIRWRRHPSASA